MEKIDEPRKLRYDFGLVSVFWVYIAYQWSATILEQAGQKPSQHILPLLGMTLGFAVLLLLVDMLLWRLGFSVPVRIGLWAASALGPVAAVFAWTATQHYTWSHASGVGVSVASFCVFYFLETWNQKRSIFKR